MKIRLIDMRSSTWSHDIICNQFLAVTFHASHFLAQSSESISFVFIYEEL